MIIDHLQYQKCLPSLYGYAENVKVEVVEAMHQMINHHSASTRSCYTWLSPSASWTVSAASIPHSPSRVVHAAPCTFYMPPRVAFALIHSVHSLDHRDPPYQSQQARLQKLENMTCCRQSPYHRSDPCSNHQFSRPISRHH